MNECNFIRLGHILYSKVFYDKKNVFEYFDSECLLIMILLSKYVLFSAFSHNVVKMSKCLCGGVVFVLFCRRELFV